MLLRLLSLAEGRSANAIVTELLQAELDRRLPGKRAAFENRAQIADDVLRRRGVAPESREYEKATREARGILDGIDRQAAGKPA